MPNTREKLIELIGINHECPDGRNPFLEESCSTCPYGKADNCGAEMIADRLIANGVTLANQVASNSKYLASSEWIPVSERLPKSGVHVLLCCEIVSGGNVYKRYVCDGYYAKRYTEQVFNNSGDIACEYNEEDDEYYLEEGWYEVIKNWDDYNSIVIGDFVTHWMPLPEPPKE